MDLLDNAVRDSKVLKIVIMNSKGEILYPTSKEDLKFCQNVFSLLQEQPEEYVDDYLPREEFYDKKNKKWYLIK